MHPPLPTRAALRSTLFAVVVLALVGASCSGSESTSETTAPLTGKATTDTAVAKRPALVVKIDNADSPARPQLGINQADVVYEERVEGSVTRFAAVFQSTGSAPVGPVRSARMTDIPILSALTDPLFAYSGANAGVTKAVREAPLVDVGAERVPDAYERRDVGGRIAPHNLYSATKKLWAEAPDDARPPEPLFTYRSTDDDLGAGARAVGEVKVDFGVQNGAPVDWRWNPETSGFARSQSGTPHVDEKGVQVAPANVIIQFVDYAPNGDADSGGNPVVEAKQIGKGTCWVLTDGHLIEGTWSKPSAEAISTFTDAEGNPIGLSPGRTWVELSSPGGATIVN